jgi:hypothetical protein
MICPKCGEKLKIIVFLSVPEAPFLSPKIGPKR